MRLWNVIRPFFLPDMSTYQEPFSLGHWEQERGPSPPGSEGEQLPGAYAGELEGETISADLAANLALIRKHFSLPNNQGLMVHEITLPVTPSRGAAVLYVAGLVDTEHLSRNVIGPLIASAHTTDPGTLLQEVIEEGQGQTQGEWGALVNDMLSGSAAVLIDQETKAVTVRIEGWPKRAIDRPKVEVTVRGPQESFTEDLRTNLAQIRRRLRSPDLTVELGRVGRISRADIAVMYLRSVANPRLVAEVRRRIAGIKVDYLADSGSLMQYIEDHPLSIYPTVLSTERPDRVAAQITDGYVAVLVDNDPHALILPTTMPTLLHSAEDAYLRWPAGSWMRLIRVTAYYVALTLPALYVALVNFRQEMIPTPLLMAIAHSRETVPFTAVLEVLLMEASFDLIHEAALRVPTVIGPTIGIVGSLILGQAAVAAGIISPILVIITSATALAAFAIPSYELQVATRLWRYGYIIMAAFLGVSGLVLLHTAYVAYLCSLNSFGTPFLAPLSPHGRKGDAINRTSTFQLERRPSFVRAQRTRQQEPVTRPWSPSHRPPRPTGGADKQGEDHDGA